MSAPRPVICRPQALQALASHVPSSDLSFGANNAPVMFSAEYRDGAWQQGELLPFGPVSLLPNARSIQFGESIFEGMKALRRRPHPPHLFRPDRNAARFKCSAERIGMHPVPEDLFMQGVCSVVAACSNLIPEEEGAFLYLRPALFSTEPGYTVANSRTFRFIVTASPSIAYSGGTMRVLVEREDVRAARHGVGAAKTAGNYAAAMRATTRAVGAGFDVALWLDPLERRYVEELSGMNLFAVIDGELHTPELSDSILDGITRASVIELARDDGMRVVERRIAVDELVELIISNRCTELFATGTAAIVASITELGDADGSRYSPGGSTVTQRIKRSLLDIQSRQVNDDRGWLIDIDVDAFASTGMSAASR